MFKGIKNVIFDLDNTLYDFSKVWKKSNELTFNSLGYNKTISYDEFFKVYKNVNNELVELIHRGELKIRKLRFERLIKTFEIIGIKITEEDCEKYYTKQFDFIFDLIEKDEELIVMLKELKKNYNLILLTNGKSLEQRKKLEKLGLEGVFLLYISEETHRSKPKKEAFEAVLNDNKFLAEETLMVGDSLFHDIEPAEKLGLKTCLVDKVWHFDDDNKNLLYKGYRVSDVKELLISMLNDC